MPVSDTRGMGGDGSARRPLVDERRHVVDFRTVLSPDMPNPIQRGTMTPKPKRGRPRRIKAASTRLVAFRVSEAEYRELERAAGNLTLSEWLRDLALEAARQ